MKNKTFKLGLVAALAILACGAQAGDHHVVADVGQKLRAKDCEGALRELNAGLKTGRPEVALMAGTMFEVGACVKKDWSRAVSFYSQANEGGLRAGALRLAAGYAADANGPDMAAAMWWASRAGLQADRCTAQLPKTDDPDRFVEELRKWPTQELAVCNYVVGMLSYISADARYPIAGVVREIEGRLEIEYQPAALHFRVVSTGNATWTGARGMNEVLARATSTAAPRYRRPDGIDPAWTVPFSLEVGTDKSAWW